MIGAMHQEPTLGMGIRRARERKRWTQQRLADELKVALRTVNDWENDRSYPRNSIGALEDVLGVSLDAGQPRFRPVPDELRRFIEQTLPEVEDQRRVIGLLEGTVTWPGEAGSHSADPPAGAAPLAQ